MVQVSQVSLLAALIALAPALATAQTEQLRQPPAGSQQVAPRQLERNPGFVSPRLDVGAEVPVYQMTWRERDVEEVIRNISAAANVMLGGGRIEGLDKSLKKALFSDDRGSWTRIEAAPQLLVKYDSEFDEFRIINEEIDIQRESLGRLGEEEAQEIAEQMLDMLVKEKAVDARMYRDAAVQLGYRRTGSGALEGRPDPGQIVEYRFTYRPRLAGIEIANAGVRVGVMTSGGISSVRAGGVTPVGQWKNDQLVPTRNGEMRKIETNANQLMGRFYRLVPPNAEPVIAWSRIMYAIPDEQKTAVVPPRLIISFAERHRTDEGDYAISRRRILGFSLVDAAAGPIDFTAPAESESDRRDRKQ